MSKYSKGQEVRDAIGQLVRIEAGPFRGPQGDVYAVYADGAPDGPWVQNESELSPADADPRRDVVRQALADYHGVTQDEVSQFNWDGALNEADAVLAALDAHTADSDSEFISAAAWDSATVAPARYRDCDGDVWEQQPSGTYSVVARPEGLLLDAVEYEFRNIDLGRVERRFGPLTRI